jgi:hypothetical protein
MVQILSHNLPFNFILDPNEHGIFKSTGVNNLNCLLNLPPKEVYIKA